MDNVKAASDYLEIPGVTMAAKNHIRALLAEIDHLRKERGNAILAAMGLFTTVKEADEYLNTNNLTNITHGSILHEKFKVRLAEVKDLIEPD